MPVNPPHTFCPCLQLGQNTILLPFFPEQYQESNRKLPPGFFTRHQPVNKHQVFLDEREVTCDFHLEPCVYVIVPCTLEPQQESEFILRVFSRKHILR